MADEINDLATRLFALFKLTPIPIYVLKTAPKLDGRACLALFVYEPVKCIKIASSDYHAKRKATQVASLIHEVGHYLFDAHDRDEEQIVEAYALAMEKLYENN